MTNHNIKPEIKAKQLDWRFDLMAKEILSGNKELYQSRVPKGNPTSYRRKSKKAIYG